MCGLAGIIAWGNGYRITRDVLERLSARIAHRGPDGQGMYLNHAGEIAPGRAQAGLVHRRLAILDPEARADQPFADGEGRWIVFNGEVYNFRALRSELSRLRPAYAWRTNCDTEVLLLAYAVWGSHCVQRLNGMFAFAVWDEPQQALFVARDRMGQKPLYYASIPGEVLAFASELPALRAVPWVDTSLRGAALADYLTWGCVPRGTMYQGIQKLPPSTWMSAGRQGVECRGYFQPNEPEAQGGALSHEAAVSRTRELVVEAVRRQLVSDVPLGCFLSGGIDSSVVAAAMRAAVGPGQKVLTFCIGFDDPRYDETPYAAAVARHLGTEHRQFIVRPNAAEDLPKLAAVFGEPFADSSALPTHYLSRQTRAHVKVALSGDGGDELFGGYDRYRAMLLGRRLKGVPAPLLRLAHAAMGFGSDHPKSAKSRLRRFVASLRLPPAQRYASYLHLFDPALALQLMAGMGQEAAGMVAGSQGPFIERFGSLLAGNGERGCRQRDLVQAALAIDREVYLPEDLLVKVDRCSMLHALEVRSPFMDHGLVHFAAGLPTEYLLDGGSKRLLREAFGADLPAGTFTRRKMGFAVPIGEWFRGRLRSMLHDTLGATDSFAASYLNRDVIRRLLEEHEGQQKDHSQRLYALLMLELWWREAQSA